MEVKLEVLEVDQNYWKYTGSGLEVLEIDWKWIRSTESRLEVDQNYWKQTGSGLVRSIRS